MLNFFLEVAFGWVWATSCVIIASERQSPGNLPSEALMSFERSARTPGEDCVRLCRRAVLNGSCLLFAEFLLDLA